MRSIPLHLAFLLAACASGGSISTVSGAADSPFVGTWAQREAVAGTSFVLTLAVKDSTVAASGTYSAEGNRSGTVTGTGTISGERLRVAITYGGNGLAQFEGQLARPRVLSGALHFGPPESLTPAAIVTFDRKN